MPTYNFRNEDTGEEFQQFMSMSEREQFLEDNTHIVQLPPSSPPLTIDPVRLGRQKPADGFREVLRNIHKANKGVGSRYD